MAGSRRPQGRAAEGRGTAPTPGAGPPGGHPGPPATPGTSTSSPPERREAVTLIETKRPREYDLAVTLLRDLRALAGRQGDPAAFTKRFQELRAQHQRKPSLPGRFDKAGLPR